MYISQIPVSCVLFTGSCILRLKFVSVSCPVSLIFYISVVILFSFEFVAPPPSIVYSCVSCSLHVLMFGLTFWHWPHLLYLADYSLAFCYCTSAHLIIWCLTLLLPRPIKFCFLYIVRLGPPSPFTTLTDRNSIVSSFTRDRGSETSVSRALLHTAIQQPCWVLPPPSECKQGSTVYGYPTAPAESLPPPWERKANYTAHMSLPNSALVGPGMQLYFFKYSLEPLLLICQISKAYGTAMHVIKPT